jgi:hypothetical protein
VIAHLAEAGRSLERRWNGAAVIDEWGCDPELAGLAAHLTRLRWSVQVGGADHLPPTGPGLLVSNARVLGGTTALVAGALLRTSGRVVRFLGIPDIAPVGPVLRRLGGALHHPDELSGLLRAGHLVLVTTRPSWRTTGRVGAVDHEPIARALAAGAPVVPVATMSRPVTRAARIEIGAPLPPRHPAGPLAVADVADSARAAIQRLVDEATPPRWLLGG